jgi:hypothetical protein
MRGLMKCDRGPSRPGMNLASMNSNAIEREKKSLISIVWTTEIHEVAVCLLRISSMYREGSSKRCTQQVGAEL